MLYFILWILMMVIVITEIRSLKEKINRLKIILDLDMRQVVLYDIVVFGLNLVVLSLLTYLVFVKDNTIVTHFLGLG